MEDVLVIEGDSIDRGASVAQQGLTPDVTTGDWSLEAQADNLFYVVNKESGLLLNAAGNNDADGASIIQWGRQLDSTAVNDEWCFRPVDDTSGYFFLIAHHSGKFIGITGNSEANGANAIQYVQHRGQNQQFKLECVATCDDKLTTLTTQIEN